MTINNSVPRDFSFRPEYRLKKKKDFQRMMNADVHLHTQPFMLVIAPSDTTESRVGIIGTKKIDKRAVVRNKIRRQIREIFRHLRFRFSEAYDILFIARKAALTASYETMRRQTFAALKQHGYFISATDNRVKELNKESEQNA